VVGFELRLIAGEQKRVSTIRADFGRHCGQLGFASASDRDFHFQPAEFDRDRPADAGRGAGDERNFAVPAGEGSVHAGGLASGALPATSVGGAGPVPVFFPLERRDNLGCCKPDFREAPPMKKKSTVRLTEGELHELKRWNTPTIYNGWEQITRRDSARDAFNLEPTRDFMPHMGPMAGYALTVVCEPSNGKHPKKNPELWSQYRRFVASLPGPKIVVVQDLDKPATIGAFWGEVTANFHRALGCVGTIIDGAIRDTDEMNAAGFKALARTTAVGHAHSCPIRWDCEVEVFGRKISPGQLIHADKHGFLAVPPGEEQGLLEAAKFMDANECNTVIAAARNSAGRGPLEVCEELDRAGAEFKKAAAKRFGRKGEW
jgi:regulator of RNase E activity RraA